MRLSAIEKVVDTWKIAILELRTRTVVALYNEKALKMENQILKKQQEEKGKLLMLPLGQDWK